MKKQELWRKCQLLLIIACGTYPLVMALLDRLSTGVLMWGWLFSGSYVVLALAGMSVKGKWRLSAGIAMAAGMTVLAFLLAPAQARFAAAASAALCGALLIWSLKMSGWSSREEIPVAWIACGIIAHLLGQVLLHTDRVAGGSGLSVHSGSFLAALFGFVLLTLLSMNRGSLTAASGKRQSVPALMRHKNSLMILGFFLLAVLASLLPSAFSGMMEILRQAVAWLVRIVLRLIPDTETQKVENTPAATGEHAISPGGDGAALVLDPMVEKFMAACGAVLFFALLLFVLYRLYRIAEGALRRLIGSMGKFASSVSEDYVDEVTDTREDVTGEKLEIDRFSSRLSFREPRNLAPAERIRFRYQRLMRKHPEWDAGSTARETLPRELAALYERARYSHHPVSEEDAAAFSDGIKQV